MAELVAIVGVLSSVLQIVDCSAKVVSQAYQLAKEGKGNTRDIADVERLAAEYRNLGESISAGLKVAQERESSKTHAIDYYAAELGDAQKWQQQKEDQLVRLAASCKSEGEELVGILAKLKVDPEATGARRLKESVRQGARSIRKQGEIEKRRKRLHELNGLLATNLLQQVSNPNGIQNLFAGQSSPYAPSQSPPANIGLAMLLASRRRLYPLLQSLHFAELHSRQHNIPEHYKSTFRWALDDDTSKLKLWLRAGKGIFWITGKPGSGKSTLLKYVSSLSMTRTLLGKWAEPDARSVSIASFYFWYLGNDMQKSTTGLLRSILYQVIFAEPAMAEHMFPDLVKNGEMREDVSNVEWEHARLVDAINALTACGGKRKSTKLCLFIDGLDEYVGNHLELVVLLQGLVTNNHDVKLCVSSRPWNAFRMAFESTVPHFKMEDLTRGDIHHYITDRIRRFQNLPLVAEDSIVALIDSIATKAEGVFLWVYLVVNSILDGFAEGENARFLLLRVQAFPADLRDFFELMIRRVHEVYRYRAYQSLKLAWIFEHHDGCNGWRKNAANITDFWIISQEIEGLGDTEFPRRYEVSWVTPKRLHELVQETIQFLSACTKDLLIVDPTALKVRFLHRTVYDFLNTAESQYLLDSQVPNHLKDSGVLHLLNLTRLKLAIPWNDTWQMRPDFELYEGELISTCIGMSMSHAHEFLNQIYAKEFDLAATQHYRETSVEFKGLFIQQDFTRSGAIPMLISYDCTELVSECLALDSIPSEFHFNLFAAALGRHSIRRFSLRKAKYESLFMLLALGEYSDLDYGKVWLYFLQRWSKSKKVKCKRCQPEITKCSKQLQSRYIWDLAEVILDYLPRVSEHAEFLTKHVPKEWLLQCKATRRLVSRVETEK